MLYFFFFYIDIHQYYLLTHGNKKHTHFDSTPFFFEKVGGYWFICFLFAFVNCLCVNTKDIDTIVDRTRREDAKGRGRLGSNLKVLKMVQIKNKSFTRKTER